MAVDLQMFEKVPEEGRAEVAHCERGGRSLEFVRGETEQEAEGVPVAGNRVRARALFFQQPGGEKPLQETRKAAIVNRPPGGTRPPERTIWGPSLLPRLKSAFQWLWECLEHPEGQADRQELALAAGLQLHRI